MYFTKRFWRETFDRSLKTFGGTWLALLTAEAVQGWGDIDWAHSWGVVGLAVAASVAFSISSAPVGTAGSASLIPLGAVRHTNPAE